MRGKLAGLGVTAAAATAIAAASWIPGTASASAAKPAEATGAVTVAAPSARTAPALPAAYTPPKRNLKEGMKGADVEALQHRLNALKYYAGPADGVFGSDTIEAVWAFQEVNHLPVNGVVGAATKKDLVTPHAYRAKYPGQAGTRIEINLGMGVLVFFMNHKVALVSHVSTGGHYYFPCSGGGTCYAETQTGRYQAYYFVSGWDPGPLGPMYNPVFFNLPAGQAIHGEYNAEVPANPVSHGCVRIPYDIAAWFHKYLTMSMTPGKGTEILVYNQW